MMERSKEWNVQFLDVNHHSAADDRRLELAILYNN
ncbi:hypothetical protein IGJ87_002170 [Enterococcus sp. DIV1411a]